MDPITTAIIAGVVAGSTKMGEQIIADTYNQLRELLRKKFGARSKVFNAVKELEANPRSDARKSVVAEEVAAVNANQDQELLKVAQTLLKSVKSKPRVEQIGQTTIGDGNIQVAGDRNTIRVNKPKQS